MGRIIKCDICGFDILKNSVLQPLFAQLILCMVHSLVPFDLLDPHRYASYYDEYIGSNNITITRTSSFNAATDHLMLIDDEEEEKREQESPDDCPRDSYATNGNKIWNQMYFFLFCKLLGSHKTTRYQHMLAFTSEFYCLNAYTLKSTPRSLYGTDAGEHFNDKVKSCVHSMTNRFAGGGGISNVPSSTLDTVMNHCLWDYYNVREHNDKTNCKYIQRKLKYEHIKVDTVTLQRPVQIYQYFLRNNVKLRLNIEEFDDLNRKYNEFYKLTIRDLPDRVNNSDDDSDSPLSGSRRYRWAIDATFQDLQDFLDRMRQADLAGNDFIEDIPMCMFR